MPLSLLVALAVVKFDAVILLLFAVVLIERGVFGVGSLFYGVVTSRLSSF